MIDSTTIDSTTLSDPEVRSTATDSKTAKMPQKIESRQVNADQGSPVPVRDDAKNEPTTEEVAALAYQFWIERGSPHGSHEEDWYRAEEALRGHHQPLTRTAQV